ncbi:MAG: nucleoside triphosphate pyrophosphohydrolase [Coriobacteriia bacterium]|nr:nucleoside triphosphate pyrophosphohydrolase [Coriobacteriia bacterium]
MAEHPAFSRFVETIAALRAPDGCPWDIEQTHRSIARNMLEEAYEVVDAIEADDTAHLREELGDVLLQVVLQCQIAQDAGAFTIDEVCQDVNDKIIRRHPHVFGDVRAGAANEVLDMWDRIKRDERADAAIAAGRKAHEADGFLDSIPCGMPALIQAQKISRKVIGIGFEWETIDDIWDQVFSEIEELRQAYGEAQKDERGKVIDGPEVELEVGDVLFTFSNVALRMGIDAETALRASCRKFRTRWSYIERAAIAQDRRIEELSTEEMNILWDEAKLAE